MEEERRLNVISIKEYVDLRFEQIEKNTKMALESVDRSTDKAVQQLDKRLEGMNEFRQQLNDQTRNFITKSEHENLVEKIDALGTMKSSIVSLEVKFWMLVTFASSVTGYKLNTAMSLGRKPFNFLTKAILSSRAESMLESKWA